MTDEGVERIGHCHKLAAEHVLTVQDGTLVHGTVLDRRAATRICHAWVEFDGGQIYDPVFDLHCTADEYAAAMSPEVFARYSLLETAEAVMSRQTCGPWDERSRLKILDEEQ